MARRALVLDNDPVSVRMLSRFASINGLELRHAHDAGECLAALHDWHPDYLLVDPWELDDASLRKLARSRFAPGIICICEHSNEEAEEVRRRLERRGLRITGMVRKPIQFAALRKLLRYAACRTHGVLADRAFFDLDVVSGQIRDALEQRRIQISYQPKIDCSSGRIAGFEALVRWHFSDTLLAFPDAFIPFTEQSGLIEDLTLYVLDESIRWKAGLDLEQCPVICINLSATTLTNPTFIDRAASVCEQNGMDPASVIFELTETAAVDDPALALEFVTRLRMKRFHAAMDDVGTGHSSFLQLARLPFSELKIDKSFVCTANELPKSRAIVRSFVQLAHSLGMRVIAEGVEDQEALDFLIDAECDMAQGYHIARPMPATVAVAWLTRRDRHRNRHHVSPAPQRPAH